ncbi:MAG: DivIVA domain-containing protein [Clostridium sp.]|uniref:DivIVA domain-containing protein n=1 Tax=Clostridium sp. TaxID=1506 RepID=UPI002FCBB51E
MAITPNEISNKDFKKGFRGYDMDEVDTFLDALREDYEKIYKANANYKEQIIVLKEKVEHYSNMENTLQNTLVLAQSAAQQAKDNSEKEADIILREAKREAQEIIKKAEATVSEINKEYEFIKQQFNSFKSRFKGMVEAQLEIVEKIEIETSLNREPKKERISKEKVEAKVIVTKEEKEYLENNSAEKEVATDCTINISGEIEAIKALETKDIQNGNKSNEKEVKVETRPSYKKDYKKDYRKDYKKDYSKGKYNNKRNEKPQA